VAAGTQKSSQHAEDKNISSIRLVHQAPARTCPGRAETSSHRPAPSMSRHPQSQGHQRGRPCPIHSVPMSIWTCLHCLWGCKLQKLLPAPYRSAFFLFSCTYFLLFHQLPPGSTTTMCG